MQTHFTLLAAARGTLLLQHFGEEEDKAWIFPGHGHALHENMVKALKDRLGAPLRIILDCKTLDLRRENLPPVDLVRRQKIVGQQASHLFPKSLLRGAGSWRDGSAFQALHAACEAEPEMDALMEEVNRLSNPVTALSFFAAEWPDYAALISAPIPRPWAIELILTEAMGLRQIVLKNGRPIFTRLHEDCAPSQGVAALAGPIAQHLRSTREYLPRLEAGAPKQVQAQLFVPSCLASLAESEELRALDCRVVVLKAKHADLLPPEWEADMVWAAQAARQKLPFVPLVPFWMKERIGRNRIRQIIAMFLMLFGMAGIFMGSKIIFTSRPVEPTPAPAPAQPHAEAPKAPELRLDALIYNGPEDWSVWINGQKFTATAPSAEDLSVTGITPEGVAVRWERSGAAKDYLLRQENKAVGVVR